MKAKKCEICGVERKVLFKIDVIQQGTEAQLTSKLGILCMRCFLRQLEDTESMRRNICPTFDEVKGCI